MTPKSLSKQLSQTNQALTYQGEINIIEEKEYSFLDFDDFVMEHIKQAYETEV